MKVVIVGARGRSELADHQIVNEIIDDCKTRYSKLLIVTKSCDRGVGKIIKNRCLDKHTKSVDFDLLEVSLRHYLSQELPRQEFLDHWTTLNETLVALGDEFHLLIEEVPKGAMVDLIDKLRIAKRPYVTYKPTESRNGPKKPEFYQEPEEGNVLELGG